MAGIVASLVFGLGCGVSPPRPLPGDHPAHADADETPFDESVSALRMDPESGTEAQANVVPVTPGKDYPLKVCLVSGKKLGSMGKPYVFRIKGREVRLCCSGCEAPLRESLATHLEKLDKASSGEKR